jgi:hypothetical protein
MSQLANPEQSKKPKRAKYLNNVDEVGDVL